jgi:hypothetical protein
LCWKKDQALKISAPNSSSTEELFLPSNESKPLPFDVER